MIALEYYSLQISVASRRGTLSFGIPITIGTVPYRPVLASAPPVVSSPTLDYPSASAPPLTVDLPSYSDAVTTAQQGRK